MKFKKAEMQPGKIYHSPKQPNRFNWEIDEIKPFLFIKHSKNYKNWCVILDCRGINLCSFEENRLFEEIR